MRVITNWQTTLSASVTASQTTIPVSSIMTSDDTPHTITIADFDDGFGYMTIEPLGSKIEIIKFTGITDNGDNSGILTGVTRGLAFYGGTETSVAANGRTHQAGSSIVCSDAHYYYDRLMDLTSAETVTGIKTFTVSPIVPTPTTDYQASTKKYADDLSFAGAPNASTTVKGISQEATQAEIDARTTTGSTAARLFMNPGTQRSTMKSDYVVATGTPTAYAIAPTPAITAYSAGQEFTFKVAKTNTTAVTLSVNGLAATPLKRNKNLALVGGEMTTNAVVGVRFDGVNFQLQDTVSPKVSTDGRELYALSTTGTTAWTIGLSPTQTALVAGLLVHFKPDTVGGHPTLNVDSLGAKDVMYASAGGVEFIPTGYFESGAVISAIYDGTRFVSVSDSRPLFAAGAPSDLSTTGAGNNDVTITTGFRPRFIAMDYYIQGIDGTSAAVNEKGTLFFVGTTKVNGTLLATGTGDNSIPATHTNSVADADGAISGSANQEASMTLSIPSLSSTGFTLRRAVAVGGTYAGGTLRAKVSYRAFA